MEQAQHRQRCADVHVLFVGEGKAARQQEDQQQQQHLSWSFTALQLQLVAQVMHTSRSGAYKQTIVHKVDLLMGSTDKAVRFACCSLRVAVVLQVVKVAGVSLLALFKGKKEKPRS
jgi:hypothetical protein